VRRLVESWTEANRHMLGEAIKILNEDCGTKLTYSRLAEWRKGKYTPSAKTLSHLLFWVLPWALERTGITTTEAQRDALADLIWNVRMVNGQQHLDCCLCRACMAASSTDPI
jgi:hypothetical protein